MGRVLRFVGAMLVHLGNFHRRTLVIYFAILGPRFAYALTGWLARVLYRALDPLRTRSEAQAWAALRDTPHAHRFRQISETGFVHRIWNLTDLFLADRYLHPGTYRQFGGEIPEPYRTRMLDAQRRGQAAILLTAYYGPFDLLPMFLGFNGVKCSAVYLPHENPAFDAYRRRIRGRGGVALVGVEQAASRLGPVLENGGTVALVADHHADRKGLPVTFLGLPTRAIRSVGLLAWRYRADVAIAGIRRINGQFNFEIVVRDVITVADWAQAEDPVVYITTRYLRMLESIILEDPTQYIWAQPRWGLEMGEKLEGEYRAAFAGQLPREL